MYRRVFTWRLLAAGRGKRTLVSPLVLGLGIWVGFPTTAAYQDMASLVSGIEASSARWNSYIQTSVAGSVHAAEMPFADANMPTGEIAGAGVVTPGIGPVAFQGKGVAAGHAPDEERIVRSEKRGRLVNVAPVAPPKAFTAGSVFDRTSSLLRQTLDLKEKLVFAKPDIKGKEILIASAFHLKQEKELDAGVPPLLAGLVNNEAADILATAYAPAEPDYARASPFESILRDETQGRFVPPVADGDHEWMKAPLPPSVFSAAEQKCLATGIYFEARGETLRGQAAVAQVILNRVRNPTYPNTICGVVYQNENLRNRCQFSFACDGIKDRITSPQNYKVAQEIAMAVTAGKIFLPEVGSATHYHATYVRPGWSATMEKMKKIGLHIFYRTYGGGWS